jgi:hypothetical protein
MAISENAELEELIRKATSEPASQSTTSLASSSDQDESEGGGLDLNTLVIVARQFINLLHY